MESFAAYVPIDRLLSLANGLPLANRSKGTGLFADISGFTPLTELLVRQLGPQRGGEELTRQINQVYDALIGELYRYGGTVIAFSGDAITCWFDEKDSQPEAGDERPMVLQQPSVLRAVASALGMQKAMEAFADRELFPGKRASLAVKVAVAAGSARRFLVGDPKIHVVEALAGKTVDRLAAAEHLADRGEIILDPPTAASLEGQVSFSDWKAGQAGEGQFGVVCELLVPVRPEPWPEVPTEVTDSERLRQWLLPPVYKRLQSGQGEFLAEFRPAVSLFLSFGGIDYDGNDQAGEVLDQYIRQAQRVIEHYDGALVQLTFGDKGSYLQAAFGAPIAHENDTIRACRAGLELLKLAPVPAWSGKVKIGICRGRLRTGAYGATIRRTYGVLGDEVNLAARLMQAAAPGQILVSRPVQSAADEEFLWDEQDPIRVKGKSNPIQVFGLRQLREKLSIRLQEPQYSLPLVGRTDELTMLKQKTSQARQGRGQILAIKGEAGMGKSRLVAAAIQQASQLGFACFGGECQSYGMNTSYLVWQAIWRGIFGLAATWPAKKMAQVVEEQLVLAEPHLGQRTPLLGPVLGIPILDNDLTRPLDAKTRKTSLEALLVDFFRLLALRHPIMIVLENCQWMDVLSHDLLEAIGRVVGDLPVLVVMAYRPLEAPHLQEARVSLFPYFQEIQLAELNPPEASQLIRLKLSELYGEQPSLTDGIVEQLAGRTQGNPFYIEEVLSYLHDQSLDLSDEKALSQLELPSSLHSLVLSRLDQRSESQKTTLKVASVIGRRFKATWLWGTYPPIGLERQVKADLEELSRLDITPLDTPEPDLGYIFKHIVTQEVAYQSMPYNLRELLHGLFGHFIEGTFPNAETQFLDLLAYHFEHSQEDAKKRYYLLKAGENAQAHYANEDAISYYQKVLNLLPLAEQIPVFLKLGKVLELVGSWKEAEAIYQQALELTEQLDDRPNRAWSEEARAELLGKQGKYEEAKEWLGRARQGFEKLGNRAGLGQVLHYAGTMAAQQGDYEGSRQLYEQSLEIRRQLEDWPRISALLSNLGIVARYQGDLQRARSLHEEALAIRRQQGDRSMIAVSLNNLGNVALDQTDFEAARRFLEEAIALQQEVGDRFYIANAMNNLGNVVRDQGDYLTARRLYHESLAINRDLGAKWAIAYLLEDIGCLESMLGQSERSLLLIGAASRLREVIGAPHSKVEKTRIENILEYTRQILGEAASQREYNLGRETPLDQAIRLALTETVAV